MKPLQLGNRTINYDPLLQDHTWSSASFLKHDAPSSNYLAGRKSLHRTTVLLWRPEPPSYLIRTKPSKSPNLLTTRANTSPLAPPRLHLGGRPADRYISRLLQRRTPLILFLEIKTNLTTWSNTNRLPIAPGHGFAKMLPPSLRCWIVAPKYATKREIRYKNALALSGFTRLATATACGGSTFPHEQTNLIPRLKFLDI